MIDRLRARLPQIPIEAIEPSDMPTVRVPEAHLVEVCRLLHDDPDLACRFLADITAVDWWPREPRFEVVYHLASERERLRLKVALGGHDAHLPTLQPLWPAANWLEREVWDMFGIVFDDHGDLRRLLMPEDWDGYPLRKDFPVQIRLRARADSPLQVSEEEFRANLAADRAARHPAVKS
jgi:NADH-quinone oxidoreductase subunit C